MLKLLKELCSLYGTSGDEQKVCEYITAKLNGIAGVTYSITPLGSVIALKKGAKAPKNKVMLDAHMDEVGLIITDITSDGYLKFATVGGIDSAVLAGRSVKVGENLIDGVIGLKPVHLLKDDESKKIPAVNDLYIDIGAQDTEAANKLVHIGDTAYFYSEFIEFGDGKIKCRAIDDRLGCAIMLKLILDAELEYDTYFSFSVGEEVGGSGAKTSTYEINPDYAIVLEATTAADVINVTGNNRVCVQGNGPAISFMDRSTVYDRKLFAKVSEIGLENSIPCQSKTLVAGGNNAGSIHNSRDGVRTVAISVPCRYLHSAVCVADKRDIDSMYALTEAVMKYMYNA